MNVWFTADTHLGHCNIIRYCKRPFQDHEEMNEGILQRFREVLRPGDILYHLGDVCHSEFPIKRMMEGLPGIQMHLILGNHDKAKLLQHPRIVWTGEMKSFRDGKQSAFLCHYPMRSWRSKSRGAFHLFGHCHGTLPGWDRSMDVGVDTHDFYPYSWEEIQERLKDIPIYKEKDEENFFASEDTRN